MAFDTTAVLASSEDLRVKVAALIAEISATANFRLVGLSISPADQGKHEIAFLVSYVIEATPAEATELENLRAALAGL